LIEPIENGEIVEIEGKKYSTRILGNYSDCVIFDPVEECEHQGNETIEISGTDETITICHDCGKEL
jgi:hypothetical protein